MSVVICAWTLARRDVLWRNLASLCVQTTPPAEVIVVSDGNAALAAAVRADWPGVRVVEHAGPPGLSGARNAGLTAARSDVVVFLDDDAVPEPSCLARLAAPFADPAVAGVGGRAVPVWAQGARPRWWPREFDWVVGCSYVGQPEEPADVRNLMGCVMALRAEVPAQLGGFRTTVGRVGDDAAGCEETELCIRWAQRTPGARFRFEPRAVVQHHVDQHRASWRYFVTRCRAEGRSKAVLAQVLGSHASTATERGYVRSTLPRAVRRELVTAALHGDVGALARVGSIVVGVAVTATAYAGGRLFAYRSGTARRERVGAARVAEASEHQPGPVRAA